jgi:small subunit ribosomal protein S8
MVTDLIADQLTVMRNAIMAKKKDVIIRKSGILENIISIMKKEGFIQDFKVIADDQQGKIKIYLKWTEDGMPVMEGIKRESTPGRRRYVATDEIKSVMGGVGLSIISTNKGLLTDTEAKKEGIGGEILCTIW